MINFKEGNYVWDSCQSRDVNSFSIIDQLSVYDKFIIL